MSRSFLYHIFPGFVCFVLYLAKISCERLLDHWSSGNMVSLITRSVSMDSKDSVIMR